MIPRIRISVEHDDGSEWSPPPAGSVWPPGGFWRVAVRAGRMARRGVAEGYVAPYAVATEPLAELFGYVQRRDAGKVIAYLDSLEVSIAARRQGLGRALMKSWLRAVQRQGSHVAYLYAGTLDRDVPQAALESFYFSFGFQGIKRLMSGGLWMRLELP